jgi:hypothetical protein
LLARTKFLPLSARLRSRRLSLSPRRRRSEFCAIEVAFDFTTTNDLVRIFRKKEEKPKEEKKAEKKKEEKPKEPEDDEDDEPAPVKKAPNPMDLLPPS